jgi:hypothetical protein
LGIIKKHKLAEKISKNILDILIKGSQGDVPETLKQGGPVFREVRNIIVG